MLYKSLLLLIERIKHAARGTVCADDVTAIRGTVASSCGDHWLLAVGFFDVALVSIGEHLVNGSVFWAL